MDDIVGRIFSFAAKGKDGAQEVIGDFSGKASSAADTAADMFRNAVR
jgi:hypothetical protein